MPAALFAILLGVFFYLYSQNEHPERPRPAPRPRSSTTATARSSPRFHAEINRTEIRSRQDAATRSSTPSSPSRTRTSTTHGGVSILGIVRAAWTNVTHGQVQQGGSTITQQYVKNVYTGSERTIGRKIKEAILAVKLEHKYTKDEILEKYLNTVYFGNGAYGVRGRGRRPTSASTPASSSPSSRPRSPR